MEFEVGLVALCLDAATGSLECVEAWRRQRRTLERFPSHLAGALFNRLRRRRLLFPSLLEVFQHCLEDVDLKGEMCVDEEWMAYLGGFRYLRSLNLADCKMITNSSLWSISGMSTLKELDLSRCSKVSDHGVRHLLSITSLEKLYVSETKMAGDGIVTCFESFENLRVLDMGGLRITDRALSSLQVLKHLEHLDVWGSRISDKGAATFKAFPKLSYLNVAWTNVHRIPVLPSITCLNMSFCTIDSIFDEGFGVTAPLSKLLLTGAEFSSSSEAFSYLQPSFVTFLDLSQSSLCEFHLLAGMRRLEHLNLSSSRITDELIADVASIGVNLKSFDLSNTKVTSVGISMLVGNTPKLEVMLLSYTEIDDSCLPYFVTMPSLKKMDLSYTKIRGFSYSGEELREKSRSLVALSNLNSLEDLNLEGIDLTDDTSNPLVNMKGLRSLSLKSDNLTYGSFHMLSRLPNLEFLGFCGTVLTDTGLLLFQPPSSLKKLDLRDCWLLTEGALSSFCKQFLHIEVKHELLPPSFAKQITMENSSYVHGSSQSLLMKPGKGKSLQSSRYPVTTFKGTDPLPISNKKFSFFKDPRVFYRLMVKLAFLFYPQIDERLKYSREKLLELQYSPLSNAILSNQEAGMLEMKKL